MTAPLTFFRTHVLPIVFICLSSVILIACESGPSTKAPIPEINTFNIYTSGQNIYSFSYNEETKTSSRTLRAKFDGGENQFIELNTDDSKQGFEYAAYVFENGIFLLNYDKATNGKITKLTQVAQDAVICSIVPRKTASRDAFRDSKRSNRSTRDLPILTIEYQNGPACTPASNFRDTLDFSAVIDDNPFVNTVSKSAGKSEFVLGELVTDYASAGLVLSNDSQSNKGSTGFLGFDTIGKKLVLNYTVDGEDDQWSTSLISLQDRLPLSQQVSNLHVLVQNDDELYVLNTVDIFKINTEASNVPVQARIDDLFQFPTTIMPNETTVEVSRSQYRDKFLIKHDNALFFFQNGNFTQIPSNQIQNEPKIDFDLTANDIALVIQENFDSSQSLILIPALSEQASTLITAEKIELQVIDNEFYVNTLELNPGAGWQAHWYRNNLSAPASYNNSRFVFSHDLREINNTLLLLSSDDSVSAEIMIKPSLFIFDKNQANGRKKGITEGKVKRRVDFSLGQFNTNISTIEHGSIVNDLFGKIVITGDNLDSGVATAVQEHYYFNPSQTHPATELSEQSLRLMSRIEL